MKTQRICLFGGSFNPPHVCHVLITTWALSTLPIDKIWWIPTYSHAFGKNLLSFKKRIRLVKAATSLFDDRVAISEVEKTLGGESRTIDTLTSLREKFPTSEFSLLIGADILEETHKWKSWDRIVETTKIHVIGRSNHNTNSLPIVLPNVSSSALREAIANKNWEYCATRIPRLTLEIIQREGLFHE